MTDTADEGVLDLVVVQLRRESERVLSVLLADAEAGQLPEWTAGAHIDLLLPCGWRQYSLCGDPGDRDHYRIAVLREERSRGGSDFIHESLRPGDLVEVGGPRNHFALEPAVEYLFIAGGVGITPILPMVRQAETAHSPWRLVYGGRSAGSMAFTGELASYGDKVELVPEDEAGLIDLDRLLGEPSEGTGVYCCGPTGLLEAVERACQPWPTGVLHVERFAARALPPGQADRPFTVRCARSGIDVRVAAGDRIIDVLELAGIYVPTACRDGLCGSCETRVLSGVVEHRDSVLTALQQAAGDRMMVCVSRAAGDLVEIDA